VLNAEADNAAVAGRAMRAIDDEIREVAPLSRVTPLWKSQQRRSRCRATLFG
jgi:hypothetical protein